MKVSVNNLSRIANDYIMQVIAPKMPNNYMKFGLAFAANYVGSSFINQQLAKCRILPFSQMTDFGNKTRSFAKIYSAY